MNVMPGFETDRLDHPQHLVSFSKPCIIAERVVCMQVTDIFTTSQSCVRVFLIENVKANIDDFIPGET